MIVRKAEEKDLAAIIALLKLSLGESLMPKSEAYWRWKHVDNPFGASPVLLAEEGGQLIGVRAFMRWEWEKNWTKWRAIRAVDTATHPDHQGKGIFKKLTLQLLDDCQSDGVDMVFNTPNSQSKPGYLKMGWEEAGSLPVRISIKKPLNLVVNKLRKQEETKFLSLNNATEFHLATAIEAFQNFDTSRQKWQTPYTHKYLQWRYLEIPMIPYYGVGDQKNLVIFRLKQGGLGTELRICEVFGEEKELLVLLKKIWTVCSFDYMSISGLVDQKLPGLFQKKLGIGPSVTIRELAQTNLDNFQSFQHWQPSLGDLEVF